MPPDTSKAETKSTQAPKMTVETKVFQTEAAIPLDVAETQKQGAKFVCDTNELMTHTARALCISQTELFRPEFERFAKSLVPFKAGQEPGSAVVAYVEQQHEGTKHLIGHIRRVNDLLRDYGWKLREIYAEGIGQTTRHLRALSPVFPLLVLFGCSTTAQTPENSNLSSTDVSVLTAGYELIQFDLMECQEMPSLSDNKDILSIAAKLCADANGYKPGLNNLASAHGVTLPNTLPDDLINRYLSLHYQNSNADLQYLNDQIYSHKNALGNFQEEVSSGQNLELIADSRAVIPVVQGNLNMLQQALKSIK